MQQGLPQGLLTLLKKQASQVIELQVGPDCSRWMHELELSCTQVSNSGRVSVKEL